MGRGVCNEIPRYVPVLGHAHQHLLGRRSALADSVRQGRGGRRASNEPRHRAPTNSSEDFRRRASENCRRALISVDELCDHRSRRSRRYLRYRLLPNQTKSIFRWISIAANERYELACSVDDWLIMFSNGKRRYMSCRASAVRAALRDRDKRRFPSWTRSRTFRTCGEERTGPNAELRPT